MDKDQALISDALAGSARAWEELVRRHESRVYNFSLRLTGNETDARDLMQEVFLGVYRNLKKFRGDSRFSTWLFRIAHNKAVDMSRRRYQFADQAEAGSADPMDRFAAPDSQADPLHELLESQGNRRVAAMLNSLSWEQRMVVELKVFQCHTFEEIAALESVPANTAKTRFYTALKNLKAFVEQNHVM